MKIEESSWRVAKKKKKDIGNKRKKGYENNEFDYSRKSNIQQIEIPGRKNTAIEVRTFSKK